MPRATPHDPSPARDLRPVAHRRGSVAVAVLIAMVVLTLVVFSVVRGGLHDREISATRVQSSRAFYAAEAATNIALAEVFSNTDHDGDGTIGTLSNDSNTANDPTLAGSQFYVTTAAASSGRRFRIKGRNGTITSQRELWVQTGSSALEGFEAFASGTTLNGVGGWEPWDSVGTVSAHTSDTVARTGTISIDIGSSTDIVHFYTPTSGTWTYTAYQYIGSSVTGTDSYFILMNTYSHGGAKSWSTQVCFRLSNNTVFDNMVGYVTGSILTLQRDRWVPIVVQINLDAGTQTVTYDGNTLFSGSWNRLGGVRALAAVDLFGNGATHVYWDDIQLVGAGVTYSKISEWTPQAPTP